MCSRHGSDQTAWLGLDAHSAVKMCRACRAEGRTELDGLFAKGREAAATVALKLDALAEQIEKSKTGGDRA